MKHIYKSLILLLIVFVSSCNDERESYSGVEGKILVNVSLSDARQIVTKADYGNEWNPAEDCMIELFKSGKEEVLYTYNKISELPENGLTLEQGDYRLEVIAGEKFAATFSKGYYQAKKEFTVIREGSQTVELVCGMENVLSTVKFADELKDVSEAISVSILGEADAELTWEVTNSGKTGYFILSDATDLAWTFEGVVNGKSVALGKTIENVKPNTNYIITFSYNEGQVGTPSGGVIFEIEIVEPEVDDKEIDLSGLLVSVEGSENGVYEIEKGSEEPVLVTISSGSPISSVNVSVDSQTQTAFGIAASEFDFMQMNETEINEYATLGILFKQTVYTKSTTIYSYGIEIFAGKVAAGDYSFIISAEDDAENNIQQTLNISVVTESVESVETVDLQSGDAWAMRAMLRGILLNETNDNINFEYRIENTDTWSSIPATINNNHITASVTGLIPNTAYEYRVIAGEQKGNIKKFTTEEARQLPNGSFEDWGTDTGKVPPFGGSRTWAAPYLSKEDKFWDTGNWGSQANNKTLTDKSTQNVVEGIYSARLESQQVGISSASRFAAGNIFTGSFDKILISGIDAKTAGGQLTFGREFISRPTALKGWFQYTNGGAIKVDEKVTLPQDLIDDGAQAGLPDKANVYIALIDKGEPFNIVNTTATGLPLSFFNKNDPSVIAFGEWEYQTTTTSMQQFDIQLNYNSLERIPTHIIVVCSSSKYGDYFTGAVGSILYLDNFELVYE